MALVRSKLKSNGILHPVSEDDGLITFLKVPFGNLIIASATSSTDLSN